MPSLAAPVLQEELMDDPGLDPATYAAVLKDLARVNRWTFAARPTLSFLARAMRGRTKLRLLDVGFGQGDMLRAVARWARKRGIEAHLVGVDLNPMSEAIARAATDPALGIDYRTGDYADLLGDGYDVIISSLVAHHMSEPQLAAFLRAMEQHSRVGWLVNDLHRHRLAYALFPVLTTMLRAHPIVRHDGLVSIARSFRPAEWRAKLDTAGLSCSPVRIVRTFPFRLCVERLR
ncbi:methyltransferase domain-containing protein [Sphingobium sp. DEHP117]|uniref:methyltransferase domain-containing protein n=1 Tax=Sphingobium sp. DEHP117 TaxID=2993436 RepID=UPI0027D74EA9|nr:methyltransferase domain-containing protein [Sphingobium sp. DEHP117]MDQ4419453.1 methyltransferase domain-containing protein [Sphingobium sp. DEHP117]